LFASNKGILLWVLLEKLSNILDWNKQKEGCEKTRMIYKTTMSIIIKFNCILPFKYHRFNMLVYIRTHLYCSCWFQSRRRLFLNQKKTVMNKMRNKKRGSIGLELLISNKISIKQGKNSTSTNDLQIAVHCRLQFTNLLLGHQQKLLTQKTIRELEAFMKLDQLQPLEKVHISVTAICYRAYHWLVSITKKTRKYVE